MFVNFGKRVREVMSKFYDEMNSYFNTEWRFSLQKLSIFCHFRINTKQNLNFLFACKYYRIISAVSILSTFWPFGLLGFWWRLLWFYFRAANELFRVWELQLFHLNFNSKSAREPSNFCDIFLFFFVKLILKILRLNLIPVSINLEVF